MSSSVQINKWQLHPEGKLQVYRCLKCKRARLWEYPNSEPGSGCIECGHTKNPGRLVPFQNAEGKSWLPLREAVFLACQLMKELLPGLCDLCLERELDQLSQFRNHADKTKGMVLTKSGPDYPNTENRYYQCPECKTHWWRVQDFDVGGKGSYLHRLSEDHPDLVNS